MTDELIVNDRKISLTTGFIIDAKNMDGIVFYARPDLNLGSGYGSAIATQGGPKVQEELKKIGGANVTEVVVTGGGNLQTKHILHAVGPRFQEENLEEKLKATILNTLKKAEEHKLQKIVFPAMGAGFYGVPLEACARMSLELVREFLPKAASLKEVSFCLRDSREFRPFQERLQKMKSQ
ncbi:MAG: Appr-1-p processing domain protein [Deltaproteobacteria bacterium]|nr:Appr-1-p processing domain protein [Deltaproteobacteria bacterium]